MDEETRRHLRVVDEKEYQDSQGFEPRDGGLPRLWDFPIVFQEQTTDDDELTTLDNYDAMVDTLEQGGRLIVHYLNDNKRVFSPNMPKLTEYFERLKTHYEARLQQRDPASTNAAQFIRRDLARFVPSLRNKESLVRSSDRELHLIEGTSKEFLFKILLNILRWGEDHVGLAADYVDLRKEVIEWYLKSDTYGQMVVSRVDLKTH